MEATVAELVQNQAITEVDVSQESSVQESEEKEALRTKDNLVEAIVAEVVQMATITEVDAS